ncbi:hypothetical protein FO519_006794 [Halicephalobus sp. NKZ332]|nr:hypothetical protein FO519_006794 [Halicephalobus sp. NKZ332]
MKVVVTYSIILFLTLGIDFYNSTQKDKCMRQVKSKITTFLTDDQVSKLIDKQMGKIVQGNSPDNITTEFPQDLIGILTTNQYSNLMMKGLACNSALGNTTIIDMVTTVGKILCNNFISFIAQLCDLSRIYQNKGMTADTCAAKLYGKINQFLMDKQIDKMNAGEPPANITSEFSQDLLNVLTSSQYSKLMMNGLACNSGLGNITIFDLISNLGNVFYNNYIYFVTQLCDLYNVYKKKGMTTDTCAAKIFGKINQFLTHKRLETITCRFRSYYTDKQWTAVYKNLNFVFLYDEYPCCIPSSG